LVRFGGLRPVSLVQLVQLVRLVQLINEST
jgi:hypothetical protein